MTTISPSLAERNRDAAAVNLAARHLADRPGRHITARIIEGGLAVWDVESQTQPGTRYTVTREADGWPADTCSCEDHVWRHMRCKHQRAVDALMGDGTPAPSLADERAARDAAIDARIEAQRRERLARRRSRDYREECDL